MGSRRLDRGQSLGNSGRESSKKLAKAMIALKQRAGINGGHKLDVVAKVRQRTHQIH